MDNSSDYNIPSGLLIDLGDLARWAENLAFPSQLVSEEIPTTITRSTMDQGATTSTMDQGTTTSTMDQGTTTSTMDQGALDQDLPQTVSFAGDCSTRHRLVPSPSNVYQPAPGVDEELMWTAVKVEPGLKEDEAMLCEVPGLKDLAWQLNENLGLNGLQDFGVLGNQGDISGTAVSGADLSPGLPVYDTLTPGNTTDALDPIPAMTSQQDSGWLRTATVPDSTAVLSPSPASLVTSTEKTPKVAKKPRRPYRQDLSQFSPTVASRKERRREQNRKAAERLRIKRKSYYDDLEKKLIEERETQRKQREEIARLKILLASMQRRLASHSCTERCLGRTRYQN